MKWIDVYTSIAIRAYGCASNSFSPTYTKPSSELVRSAPRMEGALPSSHMRKNGTTRPGTPSGSTAGLMTGDALHLEALAGIEQRVKDLSLQMCRPQECHP